MPDLSEEQENLPWDTRKAAEVLLTERLKYLKRDELKSYIKLHDVKVAIDDVRKTSPWNPCW